MTKAPDIPRIMTSPSRSHLRLVPPVIIIIPGSVHKDQDQERDEEEDAIHDAEGEARFLHCAILRNAGRNPARTGDSIGSHAQICWATVSDAGAVGVGDTAELIDAGYEGADEAEVDKSDEEGGSLG